MEDNHLQTFEVSGFKKFTDLKVENIGQFNLIVGDNNVGKTSLLEALLIDKNINNFQEGLANIVYHIKKFRDLSSLFFAYYFSDNSDTFPQEMKFKLIKGNSAFELIKFYRTSFNEFNYQYAANRAIQGHNPMNGFNIPSIDKNQEFNFNIPFIPFGALYSHELTRQYSNNVQLDVDRKEKLIDSLNHLISGIKNIEVNASFSSLPILLVSVKGKNRLSPLATYGDGSVKLFRILLSLFSTENYNRLMIDELDAGVHYSRLKDFIKSLIIVAKEQKKQIFATTHSKECIQYYKDALKELNEEGNGKIIRLADTKQGIKAFTLGFEEFENALIAESEIR